MSKAETKPTEAKTTEPQTKLGSADADKAPKPPTLYVIDSTAVSGPRTHSQTIQGIDRNFTFEPGKPLPLPIAVAKKFLRHEAFKLSDAEGNVRQFKRRPKQPEELGAGERINLTAEETVARFDELSTDALQARALELPNSDAFADKPDRFKMIEFLIAAKAAQVKANLDKEPEVAADAFTPDADLDEAAA